MNSETRICPVKSRAYASKFYVDPVILRLCEEFYGTKTLVITG